MYRQLILIEILDSFYICFVRNYWVNERNLELRGNWVIVFYFFNASLVVQDKYKHLQMYLHSLSISLTFCICLELRIQHHIKNIKHQYPITHSLKCPVYPIILNSIFYVNFRYINTIEVRVNRSHIRKTQEIRQQMLADEESLELQNNPSSNSEELDDEYHKLCCLNSQ